MEGEKINILFFGSSKHNFFAWNIDVKKLASKFFIDFVNAVFAPLSCFFSSQQRSHPGVVWHNTSYYLLSQRPPSKSPLPQYGAPMMPQAPLLATLCLFKAFLWTIAKQPHRDPCAFHMPIIADIDHQTISQYAKKAFLLRKIEGGCSAQQNFFYRRFLPY